MQPSIVVHGGAGNWTPEELKAGRLGIHRAVDVGWQVLASSGSALDAVEAAIVVMEDDEAFDAGRGSFLNADGQVELDAGFMEGERLLVGAVAGVQFIQNPIRLARAVMEKSDHVLLVAGGAQRFAAKMGFRPCELTDLAVPREFERWQANLRRSKAQRAGSAEPADTVGCVALDCNGHLAAGTSTGGTANKMPGRVGDVPMVGCGFYADDRRGGASSTGWGEAIAKVVLARLALGYLRSLGEPDQAAKAAIEELHDRVGGVGGVILLSPEGRPGWYHNTPFMPRAFRTAGMAAALVQL
jgi:beta-aspartyl-peptidase (threonine type)